jgi:GTPase
MLILVLAVESHLDSHRKQAQTLFDHLLAHRRAQPLSFRVGISGPPGVGKSTFIEKFGTYLTSVGHRVAVLVCPSLSWFVHTKTVVVFDL